MVEINLIHIVIKTDKKCTKKRTLLDKEYKSSKKLTTLKIKTENTNQLY